MERARLAKVFERGLDVATRLRPADPALAGARARPHWRSERWETRRGKLFLVPGDSPVGFRLPLGSLPWVAARRARRRRAARSRSPPTRPCRRTRRCCSRGCTPGRRRRRERRASSWARSRTALAIEPRDGQLCIFMPPTESAEEFAELVAAIEDTAAELDLPVLIEGYPPPDDPRLNVIKVTPDPGVIEVNIQPSHSWEEQVAITEALYEEARLSRLDTCKFLIDGRQVGTGGGNHVVIGGKSPGRQPVPAPARPPGLAGHLLAEPPQPQLPVLGPVHRPDQPGAAARRGARGPALRARDRAQPDPRSRRRRTARPGWSTGSSATC